MSKHDVHMPSEAEHERQLREAAWNGDEARVADLITAGVETNAKNTALHLASNTGGGVGT